MHIGNYYQIENLDKNYFGYNIVVVIYFNNREA